MSSTSNNSLSAIETKISSRFMFSLGLSNSFKNIAVLLIGCDVTKC